MKNNEDQPAATVFEARDRVLRALRSAALQCAGENSSLAVIAVEFDRFDALTAEAGQESAEKLFDALLRAMKTHCGRDRDRVFRVSSDRIIAVCPHTLPAGARHIASRICEAAEALPHPDDTPITLSIGIAAVAPDDAQGGVDSLDRAERSLQTARESGGHRIVGAPTTPAPRASLRTLVRSVLPKKQTASLRRQGD